MNKDQRRALVMEAVQKIGYPYQIWQKGAPAGKSLIKIADENAAYAFVRYGSDTEEYKAVSATCTQEEIDNLYTMSEKLAPHVPGLVTSMKEHMDNVAQAIDIPGAADTDWEETADAEEKSEVGQDFFANHNIKQIPFPTDAPLIIPEIEYSALEGRFPVGVYLQINAVPHLVVADKTPAGDHSVHLKPGDNVFRVMPPEGGIDNPPLVHDFPKSKKKSVPDDSLEDHAQKRELEDHPTPKKRAAETKAVPQRKDCILVIQDYAFSAYKLDWPWTYFQAFVKMTINRKLPVFKNLEQLSKALTVPELATLTEALKESYRKILAKTKANKGSKSTTKTKTKPVTKPNNKSSQTQQTRNHKVNPKSTTKSSNSTKRPHKR